jgi:hypothetical protein
MDFEIFIPIALFASIAYIVKAVVDSRVRRRLVETSATEALAQSLMESDERSRQMSALKWGLVLSAIGAAFGVIEVLDLEAGTQGTFGLLAFFAGAGLLTCHALLQRRR